LIVYAKHRKPARAKPASIVLWEGASLLTGDPIVVILSGLKKPSKNEKTGNILQTSILCADIPPIEALVQNKDKAICGNCPLRGEFAKKRGCYVNLLRGPRQTWTSWKVYGNVPDYEPEIHDKFLADRGVRLGTYGDPTAAPFAVWENLAKLTRYHTGYTHMWRRRQFWKFRGLLQASVETLEDRRLAKSCGWSTFRTAPEGSKPQKGEVHCRASIERGKKTTCSECRLCNGQHDVMIWEHGNPVVRRTVRKIREEMTHATV